ncbi:MAG: hypothetical protein QW567_00660 [Candidatus Hadarchaeales archaeon]
MDVLTAVLIIIILVLAWWILVVDRRMLNYLKMRREMEALRAELARVQGLNKALMGEAGIGAVSRARRNQALFEFVRDLEALRTAVAGAKTAQEYLEKKYGVKVGEELLNRIIANPGVESSVKTGIADEMLVGEVGRALMKGLNAGKTIEDAAAGVGIPVAVARGQVIRLQMLGYLDSRLKPTEKGLQAML